MKKTLLLSVLALLSVAAFADTAPVAVDFDKMKIGESSIPNWTNQDVKNPDCGIASVIAGKDEKQPFFNIKTDKVDTSFYHEKMISAKPGDALICKITVKGKGKISVGCYGYTAAGRSFPLPRRLRTFDVTEKSKSFRAVIALSAKGRLALGKIRPCFTIHKNSDVTIEKLEFSYFAK